MKRLQPMIIRTLFWKKLLRLRLETYHSQTTCLEKPNFFCSKVFPDKIWENSQNFRYFEAMVLKILTKKTLGAESSPPTVKIGLSERLLSPYNIKKYQW